MLDIDRITLREIRLTLKEPFRISSGLMHERRIALLELTDRAGASVMSECVAFQLPIYTAETIDTAWLAITEWLAPRVLGRTLAGPEVVHDLLEQNIRGHHMAKAALEMGCWGLAAEASGVSLSSLVARAQAAVAAGYRKVKVKIRPGQDVAFVAAVRAALGRTIGLMADANADSTYGIVTVELAGGALRARFENADLGVLAPWEYDSFRSTPRQRRRRSGDRHVPARRYGARRSGETLRRTLRSRGARRAMRIRSGYRTPIRSNTVLPIG